MGPTKTELIDLFWRSVWTFIEVGGGIMTGDAIAGMFRDGHTSVGLGQTVLAAGAGAVIALIKSYGSNKLGTGTATTRETPAAGLPAPVASNAATPAQ